VSKLKISKLAPILLAIVALALTVTTMAAITINKDVTSSGTITTTSPNLGIYSDSACTNAITSVTWGSISAGTSTNQTVYVKNTGTGTMTLSMAVSNWSPAGASTYLSVTWDKQGSTLTTGQSSAAILTLTVSPSVTGITSFSNTITLTGTG
jgi:hypothetical protein